MLLFQIEHIVPILIGKKTVTRRLWKEPRAKVGAIHKAKVKMLSPHSFANLKILDVFKQKLGYMGDSDYLKEGYNCPELFHVAWERINKTEWDIKQEPYVVEFECDKIYPEKIARLKAIGYLQMIGMDPNLIP